MFDLDETQRAFESAVRDCRVPKGQLVGSLDKAGGPRGASALDAIQIHGGAGYMAELPLEKLMRDAKSFVWPDRWQDPACRGSLSR